MGALLIVITPIVVASVRALGRGWSPIGDNGILAVRARDVLTGDHPLLGSWTSASVAAGQAVNNPGPLYFDLVALPVKLLGPSVGLAVGVMLVNVAAVSFAVLSAERIGGRRAMLVVAAATVTLAWSLGSELLFGVRQPTALVLPGLAFMVAAWGLAAGRTAMLPWAVAIGSVLVQTHLSYVYLVPIAVAGCGVFVLATGTSVRTLRRPLLASAVVGVIAWSQPLIEQFTSSGRGNLSTLLEASRQDADRIGARLGVRLVAEVLVTPPFFGRDSYERAIPAARVTGDGANVPVISLGLAVAGIVVLVAALVALTWWHHQRRDDRAAVALGFTSLCLLAACLVSVTLMPVGILGLASHQMRWIWPTAAMIAAFALFSLVTAVRRVVPNRAVEAALAGVAGIVAVATIPTYVSASGPTADRDALGTAEALAAQLGPLDDRGTLLFDVSTLEFFEPYSGYVFAQLQDRGIRFVFDDDGLVRQFGEGRRSDGDASLRIWLIRGSAALAADPRADVERVALVRGIDGTEAEELDELEASLLADAQRNGLALSDAGRTAVRAGRLPRSALDAGPGDDPWGAIGDLNLAVQEAWLDLDGERADRYERMVELRTWQSHNTVALFAAPVGVRPRT